MHFKTSFILAFLASLGAGTPTRDVSPVPQATQIPKPARYYIDATCKKNKATEDLVRSGLKGAFDMAGVGLENLMKNPIPKANADVLNWLFKGVGGSKLELSLKGILALNHELDSSLGLLEEDVRIYCSRDHIIPMPNDPGKLFDKDREVAINKDWVDPCLYNLAETFQDEENAGHHYETIILCPWFLDYASQLDPKFQLTEAIPSSMWSKFMRYIAVPIIKGTAFAPIDVAQLFDKTLLHELSHTTKGNRREDVLDYFSTYGWKNCVAMDRFDAIDNADCIALYGSISWMIENIGRTVNERGQFAKVQ
ncbi:hypothetical protein DM02DRAFT_630719 [Periconia macrospinosa]|uniref:Lysine-specific metallo-endopeptidase domain-containing protein n=1 Tax=Periconia macrospinosa TaxID=97972 RepID=A0A2V1DIT9_9PLEO|nr:hypothetical protein DM02DRAFT_630719 [Periconia macrospinosa]